MQMDSTARMLEKLDGAKFERLCGQVLRKMIPDLKSLIPSGINVDGKTIKSLSDGFCFVDQGHYATIHITTNSSNLRKKWLYSGKSKTTPLGDLIKGINQAKQIYNKNSDLKFSIYLVSNKIVDEQLHLEVIQINKDNFIQVKIVEQREIVSFLDHDPEGQYLRKIFLGVDADRISRSILRDIINLNLDRYAQEIYLDEDNLVKISGQKEIEAQMEASNTSINLLTGESGFGKSTICFAILRSVLKRNQVALRIKPTVLETANSLEDAIISQLLSDYPKLFIDPKDIKSLFQGGLIVIDDINKVENSTSFLDKIITWNQIKDTRGITVLCPILNRNLEGLENKAKKAHRYTVIYLKRVSFYDCKSIISQRINNSHEVNLTEQQIHSLIIDTGLDPLLLDLCLHLLVNNKKYIQSIASESIKSYVTDKIRQVSIRFNYAVHEIYRSLILIGVGMLNSRKLDPGLIDIEEWINHNSNAFRIIEIIGSQRLLFSFDDNGKCIFRHDRVRDYLLTMAASELFNDYSKNTQLLSDPYFAEVVGAAITISNVHKSTLEDLITSNPLAVFFSLKHLQTPSQEGRMRMITEVITQWNMKYSRVSVPPTISLSISIALSLFDVQNIEIITKGHLSCAELELAKFRNGVWLSGVRFFSYIDYFYPKAPTYWWNTILAHVQAKFINSIIEDFRRNLPSAFTPDGISYAYTLAGFFREPQLLIELSNSWRVHADPRNYTAYLWAILNSFTEGDKEILGSTLLYWQSIPLEQRNKPAKSGPFSRPIDEQLKSVRWEFSDEQLSLLFELSMDISFQEIISFLVYKIDHPKAMMIVLNQEMQRDATKTWHYYSDNRWDQFQAKKRLSQASLDFLEQEFSITSGHPVRRYLAWRYWTGNVDTEAALEKLRSMTCEDDSMYEQNIIWRVSQRDQSAAEAFKKCIAEKPWLVRMLDGIWSDQLMGYFDDWLIKQLNGDCPNNIVFGLELLSFLDNEDACILLIRHWEDIKWHPRAIETALFLSTEATRSLADEEIRRLGFDPGSTLEDYYYGNLKGSYFSSGDGVSQERKARLDTLIERFKYLYMYYGQKFEGKGERLTREKLESLLPYLSLFDSFSLFEFAKSSLRIGASDLCFDHFYPLLPNSLKQKIQLTLGDIQNKLEWTYRELERDGEVSVDQFITNLEKQKVASEILTEALQPFLDKYQDEKAFFIVCLILERMGTRKHLALLDNGIINSEEISSSVKYWKDNTVFSIKRRTLN